MGRFDTERQEYKLHIAELNEKVKAMHLEHEGSSLYVLCVSFESGSSIQECHMQV